MRRSAEARPGTSGRAGGTPPALPLTFRQELAPHLFRALRGGWSCAVVGLAGAGLSNLLRFAAEPRVAAHYAAQYGEGERAPLMVYVEGDRLPPDDTALAALARPVAAAARAAGWPRADQAALRALAQDEAQAGALAAVLDFACATRERQVVFVLDEADSVLAQWPAGLLRELRALRDSHKYRLAFVAGLRREPAHHVAQRAADAPAAAKFAELFDEHTFPLRPYTQADTEAAITRKTTTWPTPPSPEQCERLYRASGGHAKLLMACLAHLEGRQHLPWANAARGLAADPAVSAACAALWASLEPGEQAALWRLAREQRDDLAPEALDRLQLRGLAVGGPAFVFAEVLEEYAAALPQPPAAEVPGASRLRDPDAKPYW